jgi:hypothetical protein
MFSQFPFCYHGCHRKHSMTLNLLCDLVNIYGGYGRYRDVCVFYVTGGVWGQDKFRIQVCVRNMVTTNQCKNQIYYLPWTSDFTEIHSSVSTINLRDRRKDTSSPIQIHCLRFGLESVNCVLVGCTSFEILINVVTWVFSPLKVVRIN